MQYVFLKAPKLWNRISDLESMKLYKQWTKIAIVHENYRSDRLQANSNINFKSAMCRKCMQIPQLNIWIVTVYYAHQIFFIQNSRRSLCLGRLYLIFSPQKQTSWCKIRVIKSGAAGEFMNKISQSKKSTLQSTISEIKSPMQNFLYESLIIIEAKQALIWLEYHKSH